VINEGIIKEVNVKNLKIDNPCICWGYPDCPFMDDYKDENGNIRHHVYKNERTSVKICNDKDNPKHCIKNPINQPEERMKTLKIIYKEARTNSLKSVSIYPYPYNDSPAFIFIESRARAGKKDEVINKVLISRSDAQKILDSDRS